MQTKVVILNSQQNPSIHSLEPLFIVLKKPDNAPIDQDQDQDQDQVAVVWAP